MNKHQSISRRMLVKSSVAGILAAALPSILFAKEIVPELDSSSSITNPDDRFPAIPLTIVSEVVGVSHFNPERLKELVDPRPELARASWDWGFGDWESAIDAASHVGRIDIVQYLVSKGASPTIFTLALLGSFDAVKAMIDSYPGIQQKLGPHGFSLMHHAKLGVSRDEGRKTKAGQLVSYLESLGDADGKSYLPMEEAETEKYLGDYKYGISDEDGFSIRLNMRKMLSLGKIGKFGGALLRTGEHEFTYPGAPSLRVSFEIVNNKAVSLTLHEPELMLNAKKITL